MAATLLSRFSPGRLAPETLEATFVQREDLAQRLLELIEASATTLEKHHTLLVGPRGTGKSHLPDSRAMLQLNAAGVKA